MDRSLQRRQIVSYGVPDRIQINPLIRMPKLVSDAADIAPRHAVPLRPQAG